MVVVLFLHGALAYDAGVLVLTTMAILVVMDASLLDFLVSRIHLQQGVSVCVKSLCHIFHPTLTTMLA